MRITRTRIVSFFGLPTSAFGGFRTIVVRPVPARRLLLTSARLNVVAASVAFLTTPSSTASAVERSLRSSWNLTPFLSSEVGTATRPPAGGVRSTTVVGVGVVGGVVGGAAAVMLSMVTKAVLVPVSAPPTGLESDTAKFSLFSATASAPTGIGTVLLVSLAANVTTVLT